MTAVAVVGLCIGTGLKFMFHFAVG